MPQLRALVYLATIPLWMVSVPAVDVDERPTPATSPSVFFRWQYHKPDLSFCNSQICVDFDGDGRRELLFASRKTMELQMLRGLDGSVVWSRKLVGVQQSLSAYDLDGDGDFEILYSVSAPGRLYVLDHTGEVIGQWDSGDHKLGNSAVIADVDGDGQLDGLFGSRSKYLLRLNMANLSLTRRRDGWMQCGCQTTAMDVDLDGRWDFFAGSGDDSSGKGVLHRYDPVTLKSVWSYRTNDNASSADPVLADIDGDGYVEVIKSVDNYAGDDAHDAIYAFETDGTLLWKTRTFSGEDSPNVADLDGDGRVEVVGMTFGGEVYCLDPEGRVRWRKDLRPILSDSDAHAYLTPIICDVNGDHELEIVAFTNGGYFDAAGKNAKNSNAAPGIVFALSADGEILDRFDVGGSRYWGSAFVCNVDDDPFLELVVSGSGGLDVIETQGFGANTEHFQRRRNYQRLNVVPWAYKDSYFIHRGRKSGVVNLTDNLVLAGKDGSYRSSGTFTTELLTLPPETQFDRFTFKARTPGRTTIRVDILDASGRDVRKNVESGAELGIAQPVRIQFHLSTTDSTRSPILDEYHISFRRTPKDRELIPEVAPGRKDRDRVPVPMH
ncbi:MAG: PQQ-binding-like beta-propeller repeat protein [Fuerstiella sp.]